MRIITGIYKGRHFDIPRSFKARPTTDFAKENIFNVLNSYIDFESINALDLFSGTGSISLELVSRGCEHVVSVEMDRDHHKFITECLKKLDTDVCLPLRGDVFRYIKSCKQQFDFIFADPPYNCGWEEKLLDKLSDSKLCDEYTTVIIEASVGTDFSFADGYGFKIKKEKNYKNNKHIFLEKI